MGVQEHQSQSKSERLIRAMQELTAELRRMRSDRSELRRIKQSLQAVVNQFDDRED